MDETLRFETDEELLARARTYCVVCLQDFCEDEDQTIARMQTRGNWCAKCNHKAQNNI